MAKWQGSTPTCPVHCPAPDAGMSPCRSSCSSLFSVPGGPLPTPGRTLPDQSKTGQAPTEKQQPRGAARPCGKEQVPRLRSPKTASAVALLRSAAAGGDSAKEPGTVPSARVAAPGRASRATSRPSREGLAAAAAANCGRGALPGPPGGAVPAHPPPPAGTYLRGGSDGAPWGGRAPAVPGAWTAALLGAAGCGCTVPGAGPG